MNKLIIFLFALLIIGCKKNQSNDIETEVISDVKETPLAPDIIQPTKTNDSITIFDIVYRDIKNIEYFNDFDMNSGTVVNYKESKWEYALVEMQHKNKRIIILEKIIETGKPKKNYKILDTIHINNLTENEFTSVGICYDNDKEDSRIFTIINGNVNANHFDIELFTNIKRAWKANLETAKIEEVSDIKGISCMNEGYGI